MNDTVSLRTVMITVGAVVGTAVSIYLIVREYKFTVKSIAAVLIMAAAMIPAGIFGELVRKLTYGEWLNMGEFISNIFKYQGTHYLGRAIFTICAVFILWHLIMRKQSGNFSKNGFGRFLDIISICMLIQVIFARIGCVFSGCCFGKTYYGFLSVYDRNLGHNVYPAVYTEIAISIVTLIIAAVMYQKRKNVFSVYCIGYAIALFAAEFMYDSSGTVKIMDLTVIQLLAILVFVTGIIYAYIFGHQTAEYIKNSGNKLPQKGRKSL